ncbi:MAG: hypothetical protein JJU02_08470 [Cryomorphaceae bacterium]|nr:hypothetical protein [Cryomorphaceae bacterium]
MKRATCTLILLLSLNTFTQAQMETPEVPKIQNGFDLAIGMGDGIYSGALMWQRTHGISGSNKWRLGYGVRFSGFTGSNLTYITAPANLTSDDATIDTLGVNDPLSMGFNAVIVIEYQFSSKLKAGFNIDALGLGFGRQSASTFISSDNDGSFTVANDASPTSFNLLLVGDNDIGQLKSEFYVGYAVSDRFWIRGGLDMTFSEYTTENTLAHNNDRFRFKAMMFFLGLTYAPF